MEDKTATSFCNGFVAVVFACPVHICLQKTTIYLDNEVYRKISTHFQGLENANENAVLASQTFSQWLRGSKCPIIPAVQAGNVGRNVDISYTKKTKVGLKKICNSY